MYCNIGHNIVERAGGNRARFLLNESSSVQLCGSKLNPFIILWKKGICSYSFLLYRMLHLQVLYKKAI